MIRPHSRIAGEAHQRGTTKRFVPVNSRSPQTSSTVLLHTQKHSWFRTHSFISLTREKTVDGPSVATVERIAD